MSDRLCWVCDKPLAANAGPGRPARYCGIACKQAAKNARNDVKRRQWQHTVWDRQREAFRVEYLDDAA